MDISTNCRNINATYSLYVMESKERISIILELYVFINIILSYFTANLEIIIGANKKDDLYNKMVSEINNRFMPFIL